MANAGKNGSCKRTAIVLLKLLVASYLITFLLLLLLTFLTYKLRISGMFIAAGIVATYVLSTFLTGMLAGKTVGRKKYLWGLVLGALYFAVLLIISFFLKGDASEVAKNVPFTMIVCMASGMLGGMVA